METFQQKDIPRAFTAICEWCEGGQRISMRSTSFLSNTSSILHVENGMSKICATFSASSVVLPQIASIRNPCDCKQNSHNSNETPGQVLHYFKNPEFF